MTRICVLGNSHVAALKGGWEQVSDTFDSVQIDFFGALSKGMRSLDVIDGRLGPRDPEAAAFFRDISGTGEFADPAAYDGFVLVGMALFPHAAINNYADFATPTTGNADAAPYYVSDDCIADALWCEIDAGMMMHVARTVRRVTDAPIHLCWQAHFSEDLTKIDWRRDRFAPILANQDQGFVGSMMDRMDDRMRDEGFSTLRQPAETLVDGLMTQARYSRGSVLFRKELVREHRELDVFHMNSDFGAACWNAWDPGSLVA